MMSKYKKIFASKDYLIINKPAGVIVHGAGHIKGPTLADDLLADYPEIARVGDDPNRSGIVHRLDRDVSGLMIVPRNTDAFAYFKKQFQTRKIEKEYTALVYGRVGKDEEEISFPLARSSRGFKMAALPEKHRGEKNAAGRRAITEFRVMKKFINYTLLKVKIKTGRTHQIRVHLLAYGHPLVGDNLYSTKKTRRLNKKLGLERIFLMASRLSFFDLAGAKREYSIDLPVVLNDVLRKIK